MSFIGKVVNYLKRTYPGKQPLELIQVLVILNSMSLNESEVVQFAQGQENNSQISIRNWLETFVKSNEHFVSMTVVTKDGRIISSDQNLQSANSN